MTYRELLEHYKNGSLDETQRARIAADIERQEAIGDYLAEQEDFLMPDGLSPLAADSRDATGDDPSARFAGEIHAAIVRAFVRAGIVVGVCVLAVVLFVIFGLPKVVDAVYDNPAKTVGVNPNDGSKTNRISLDMAVYSELFLPGRACHRVVCEPEGYGAYNIYIPGACAGKVVRNMLTLYEPAWLSYEWPEWFYVDTSRMKRYTPLSGTGTDSRRTDTEALESDKRYIATFLFREVTSYDEAAALFEEPHTCPAWYALCWQKDDGTFENGGQAVMGFTDASGLFSTDLNYSTLELVSFDSEKYPCLAQRSLEGNPAADAQTRHVCSLLRYADDRRKAFSLFRDAADGLPQDTFSQAARQTQRHGLYVYGLVTEADGAALARLAAWDNTAEMLYRESRPPVGP